MVAAFQRGVDDSGQGGGLPLDRGAHARKYSREAIQGFGVGLSERKREIERLGMTSWALGTSLLEKQSRQVVV